MTTLEIIQEVAKDAGLALAALGVLATAVAHLPFLPAKWAEFFARFASYTSQTFSVNKREPAKPEAPAAQPRIVIANKENDDGPPAAAMRGLSLAWFAFAAWTALFSTGCALTKPGAPLAPVAACAPTLAELETQVVAILESPADTWLAGLAQLAEKDGLDVVQCAVQAYRDQLDGKALAHDGAQARGLARANEYLEHADAGAKK